MAYVDQTKKAKIAAAVKAVVPKDWKYSLRVDNHSTIVMTVASAKTDLLRTAGYKGDHASVNVYHARSHIANAQLADTVCKVIDALNTDNFDHSDPMTDYFHVGHYVALQFGRWDKPFKVN